LVITKSIFYQTEYGIPLHKDLPYMTSPNFSICKRSYK